MCWLCLVLAALTIAGPPGPPGPSGPPGASSNAATVSWSLIIQMEELHIQINHHSKCFKPQLIEIIIEINTFKWWLPSDEVLCHTEDYDAANHAGWRGNTGICQRNRKSLPEGVPGMEGNTGAMINIWLKWALHVTLLNVIVVIIHFLNV